MLYRGEARQTLPPIQEWRRFDAADVQLVRGPAGAAPALGVGESPKVAISSPAQYCGLRLRRGTRIRELLEEHEVLRRWSRRWGRSTGASAWPGWRTRSS